MNFDKRDLDRHITGNYGEDQFKRPKKPLLKMWHAENAAVVKRAEVKLASLLERRDKLSGSNIPQDEAIFNAVNCQIDLLKELLGEV